MKKISMFCVLVMSAICIIIMVSTSAVAQKSTILVGDKNTVEVKRSVKIIAGQLDELKEQIKDLKKEGKREVSSLERNKRTLLRSPGENKFLITKADAQVKKSEARSDSLIAVCEQKKSLLENDLINFTVVAAGKDKQEIYDLQSRDLSKITDAMYALDYIKRKKSMSDDVTADLDSALISNAWIKDVFITVTGPGRFKKSFPLSSKSAVAIAVPGPGSYVVYCDFGNEVKCKEKRFDGHNYDYDPKTKKQYAFISGLLNHN